MELNSVVLNGKSMASLTVSGVYIWRKNEECLYVGQSINMLRRVCDHPVIRVGAGDTIEFIPCPIEQLNTVEMKFIRQLRPKLNVNLGNTLDLREAREANKRSPEEARELTQRAMLMKSKGSLIGEIASELEISYGLAKRLIHGYVPRWKPFQKRTARLKRDSEIIRLRSVGMTLEGIGRQYELSRQRVHQILTQN